MKEVGYGRRDVVSVWSVEATQIRTQSVAWNPPEGIPNRNAALGR